MSITVTTFDGRAKWTKIFYDRPGLFNELGKMEKMFDSSEDSKTIIGAALVPVRTNENFAKDFFLPTLLNHAIKVENAIGKIFAILGALFLDIVTFPIRLITVIPRFHTNANQSENLFHKYLREKGADERILNSEDVIVKMEWNDAILECNPEKSQLCEEEKSFNFIEVPTCNDFVKTKWRISKA